MRSRWRVRAGLALVLAVAFASPACGGSDEPTVRPQLRAVVLPGSPTALPTFSVAAFHGLTAHLKGRPLVVNIWASWCGPCVAEAPDLARAARAFEGRVQFLGVDIQDQRPAATAFIQRFGWPYPSVFDPDGAIRDDLGLIGQPHTVIFDAGGKQAYISSGPITEETLQSQLATVASAEPMAAAIAVYAVATASPTPAPSNGTSGLGLLLGMAAVALVVGSVSFLFLVRRFRRGVDPLSSGDDLGPPDHT